MRDSQSDALIERRRQQRGFAVARVADGGGARGINGEVGGEIIHAPLKAPRPARDAAAIGGGRVCRRTGLLFREPRIHAVRNASSIGVHIRVRERGEGVAARDDLFDRPVRGLRAARGVSGPAVHAAFAAGAEETFRERDARVGVDRMIAAKVQSEKRGRGFGRGVRRHNEQIDLRRVMAGDGNGDELEGGRAVEKVFVHNARVKITARRLGRNLAIHVVREQGL